MEGKRGGSSFDKGNRDGMTGQDGDSDGGPDGYRYKPDGLMKQSFSITTNQGQHLHLISYYSRSTTAANLLQPTSDPQLRHIRPEKGMYPDSTVHEQSSIPAVTRGPMGSPGYAQAPPQPPYNRSHYYNPWGAPPSPMHTPPPHPAYAHAHSPYYHHPHAPYHPSMYGHPQYPPPPGMTAFDRPPPPLSNNGLPPPPHAQYGPPHYQGNYPPPPPTYHSGYPYQPPPLQAPPYPAANHQPSYDHQKPQDQQPPQPQPEANVQKDDRQDSHQNSQQTAPSPPAKREESQATAGAQDPAAAPAAAPVAPPPAASSGQTIPSISAMLNAGENGQPPPRTSSRSPPGSAPRTGIDIPSHKLGFEASRDVHVLRNLDKHF